MTVGAGTATRKRRTSIVRKILKRYDLAGRATVKANPLTTDETLISGLGSGEAVTRFLAQLREDSRVEAVSEIDTPALHVISVQWKVHVGGA